MSAVRHLRATESTRREWSVARTSAYGRGVGAEFDRLCGEIETRLRDLHNADIETSDRLLSEITEFARQRSALLTEPIAHG